MTPHDPAACHDCADAEIARLTRERDEARALTQAMHEDHERALARATAAETLADGLGEALAKVPAGVKFGPWWANVGEPALAAWRKARR